MKTTNKLITACAIALIAMVACKKQNAAAVNPAAPSTATGNTTEMRMLPQKTYNLSDEQALKMIKSFKHVKENATNQQAKLVDADSLALDSSIFVLEAALNYDFDAELSENYNDQYDLTEVSLSIGYGEKISSDDLEDAYSTFSDFITGITSASIKVKVVDIYAFTDADFSTITYKAQIVSSLTGAKNPCGNITINASPNRPQYLLFCATGNPAGDATSALNQRLNCMALYPPSCFNGRYFINVTDINPGTTITKNSWYGNGGPSSTNPSPSFLFNSGYNSQSSFCGSPGQVLTPAQLNSYCTAAKVEINNNIPTSPAGVIVINSWYTPHTHSINLPPYIYCVYWNLHAQYGVLKCKGPISG